MGLKIQDGCDNACTFCIVHVARGKSVSRPARECVSEARALYGAGAREIVLTGINTALYGTESDFGFARRPGEEALSGLETIIKRIDAIEGDFRIRLSSLEPTVVDKDDVLKLLGYEKLCHHLHLSIQSGSNKVLKAMNRHYTRCEYLEIVKALRDFDPNYGITTDIIVGFPGETDDDFEDSLDIVRQAGFGKVHVFRYSPRKGTPGENMKDAVPGNVKNERASRLEEQAGETAAEFVAGLIGRAQRVLIEEERDGYAEGYTDNYVKVYIKVDNGENGKSSENAETAETGVPAEIRSGEFCDAMPVKAFKDGILCELQS